ncbi:AAA family ATPase [Aureimonas sp. AU22]|uniref:AAA family ATPase n=1 Tax=Aureimonas sp. AU22 TaxID=1638162 RepID=UPI000A4DD647|nr:AAA family ATPase [Aureimonas sp. AU22]
MYLRTLTLREFAGVSSLALDRFEDGLNVIVGDNEAGKSTVLTALRAAFFQKHRSTGEATRALVPYGRQVRPEIEIAFSLGGTDYELRKAFLQKPEAELSWPGGRLQGDAVEERLAELLRFTHSGARKPKDGDFVGTFGLLWVDQGRSTEGLDLGAGRDAVTASLEGEVSQVLGGERGRALIAASRARQDRFFTETLRVKANSPLREAEDTLERLREALGQRRAALADYRTKLQRLSDRRSVLRSYEKDDAVGVAAAGLARAEAQQRALGDLRRDCTEAERDLRHALTAREHAGERLRVREALLAAAAKAVGQEEEERLRLAEHREAAERERRHLSELEGALVAARAALEEAERRAETARIAGERARLAREIERLDAQLTEGRRLAAALDALSGAVAQRTATRRDIGELEEIERACREAEIRLSAASPTVTFAPETAGGAVLVDGKPLTNVSGHTVSARTAFHLPGFGTVTIEPGGGSASLADEAARSRARLAARLAELGGPSVEEVRRSVRAGEERAIETKRLRELLAARLPSGLQAAEVELRALREAAAALPPEDGRSDVGDLAAVRAEAQAARERVSRAEGSLDAARRDLRAAESDLVGREARAAHLLAEARRLRTEADDAEAARAMAALREDMAAAELERAAREAVYDARRRALAEGDPETVERTVAAKRRARDEIERTLVALRGEVASLEGELRVQGANALDEEIARLEGEVEHAERLRTRLALEAEASRLLHQTLLQAQREAHESWLAPIKSHVAPYLRLIHPDSDIALDEATLELTGLRRRGVDEDFRRLSAGAREQVAVVTRLALAEVIKKGGHPATVILDDALVNTDERRLERMHHVLRKAAEGLQVIILTCRERDFRDIGAPIFRL